MARVRRMTDGWHHTDYSHWKADKVYCRKLVRYCRCGKKLSSYNNNEKCFACINKVWEDYDMKSYVKKGNARIKTKINQKSKKYIAELAKLVRR